MGVLVVCILLIIILFYVASSVLHLHREEAQKAKKAYTTALNELRRDPFNRQKYKLALDLGKKYLSLSANSDGYSQYQAGFAAAELINEVNLLVQEAKLLYPQSPVEERLQRLESLHNRGLITIYEYRQQRETILDTIRLDS